MDIYSKLNLVRDTIDHVRDLIDAGGHPAHVNMHGWGDIPLADRGEHVLSLSWFCHNGKASRLNEEYQAPSCGTVACLAGWCFLNPDVRDDMKKRGHELSPNNVQDWLAGPYELDTMNGQQGAEAIHSELFHVAIGDGVDSDSTSDERGALFDELVIRLENVERAARAEDACAEAISAE